MRKILILIAMATATVAMADEVGTYEEGLAVGGRNGALIAQRVHKRVIGESGCSALNEYQSVLNVVTSHLRRPAGSLGFVRGFFQGYLNAIREAVRETRTECKQTRFSDGVFVGSLYGNFLCQVSAEEREALGSLQYDRIYDGWSEGQETLDSCVTAFAERTEGCGLTGIAAQLLASTQSAVCSDVSYEQGE